MAYKIVISNQKGGVAKTTTAVNIADAFRYMNYRVLLLDLDPQCNSTSVFLKEAPEKDMLDVFLKKSPISECIYHTKSCDIVAGSEALFDSEDLFIRAAGGTKIVKNALKEVDDQYDFVIMDTPPNCGAYMRNGLFAADGILTPVQAKTFALNGLSKFIDTVKLLKDDGNENLAILGILLTMYDKRHKQDRDVIKQLPAIGEQLGIRIFNSYIRVNQSIENAISNSESLFTSNGNSNGANDYADLALEILDIIEKKEALNGCA